jgi:hypothetical protein
MSDEVNGVQVAPKPPATIEEIVPDMVARYVHARIKAKGQRRDDICKSLAYDCRCRKGHRQFVSWFAEILLAGCSQYLPPTRRKVVCEHLFATDVTKVEKVRILTLLGISSSSYEHKKKDGPVTPERSNG